jgi:hypothetical protein
MKIAGCRAGATLAELLLSLSILTCAAGLAWPRLAGARDEYAVRAARDAAAALVDRTRLLAQARGSARLRVDPAAGRMQLESPIGVPAGTPLLTGPDWGAALDVAGSAGAVVLDFDGRGLGRLANRTLQFRRGTREARLTLSSYGRVRRW